MQGLASCQPKRVVEHILCRHRATIAFKALLRASLQRDVFALLDLVSSCSETADGGAILAQRAFLWPVLGAGPFIARHEGCRRRGPREWRL